jgi:hypothetical protein
MESEDEMTALCRENWLSAQAPGRATGARGPRLLCQLRLSGAELAKAEACRVQEPALAKAGVEWHPGELYPRVGFIVTNLARPAQRVVAFYNPARYGGTMDQGRQGAIKWTRLSCHSFAANAVRLQIHALAYNLRNFMRTLAMPKTAGP